LIKSSQVKRPRGKLPPVFPIVIYNGKPKWRASLEIASLIAAPGSLARWSPSFRHHVLDEGQIPGEQLASESENLLAHLITLETQAPNSVAARDATAAFGRYFQRYRSPAYDSLRRAVMVFYQRVIFAKLHPSETIEEFKDFQEVEAMYATRMEEWSHELRQEGRQKGRQEGRQEGEAAVLLRLLTRRFGPLGAAMTEQVRQASSTELEQWADNILDACTLDEVFRPH